jgi:hypothetical protein
MTTPADAVFLLDLPPDTLVAVAAGYLAYRVAYTGKDRSHQTIDVIFATSAFAAVARSVMVLAGDIPEYGLQSVAVYLLALIIALFAASAWRSWGEEAVFNVLRWTGVSSSDRHSSAIESVVSRRSANPSQLVVRKKDGSTLMCERLADFSRAAFGPCLLAPDGSVALYVTHFKASPASPWDDVPEASKDWGPALTFVPASEVAELELRYPTTA